MSVSGPGKLRVTIVLEFPVDSENAADTQEIRDRLRMLTAHARDAAADEFMVANLANVAWKETRWLHTNPDGTSTAGTVLGTDSA